MIYLQNYHGGEGEIRTAHERTDRFRQSVHLSRFSASRSCQRNAPSRIPATPQFSSNSVNTISPSDSSCVPDVPRPKPEIRGLRDTTARWLHSRRSGRFFQGPDERSPVMMFELGELPLPIGNVGHRQANSHHIMSSSQDVQPLGALRNKGIDANAFPVVWVHTVKPMTQWQPGDSADHYFMTVSRAGQRILFAPSGNRSEQADHRDAHPMKNSWRITTDRRTHLANVLRPRFSNFD